ncbi:MAG: trigger factor [Luteolibacter sp.]
MKILVEKQPNCTATLRVEIPADKVQNERQKVAQSLASKAKVPGFRPGKAPRAVIEKRFNKEIEAESRETLINSALDEAIKQEDLKVLDFGRVEDLSNAADGGLSFSTRLTLAPEVKLPDYKGIKVTVPSAELPDEDLQGQLETLRERFADFNDVEGRAAEMGDFAVINYTSTIDGKPSGEVLGKSLGYLEGREGFWVRIDEKTFLPGFAAQLVGMKPGEQCDITVTLPEDFPVADLRNRQMTFATTLGELKQSILPELNDELAERLAPGKTLAEITEIIRTNMAQERKRRIDDMKVNQIVAHFTNQADFELPEDLVAQETQNQADAMVRRGVQSGVSEEQIQSQQDDIFANAKQQAVSNLRANFILQEIARAEKILVNDQELVGHLIQLAAARKVAPKKFIADMRRSGRISSIRSSMIIGKAIDFLVEHADVVESAEATLAEA